MLCNPQPGQPVQVHYRASMRTMPLHGRCGTVVVASRGRPRNHLIDVDGSLYTVPCGNLISPRETESETPA